MILIGYIFTILNYGCYCSSRFMKEKKNILFLEIFAKLFSMGGLYCFGSLTGTYSMAIGFLILIISNIKERNKNKINNRKNMSIYMFFQFLYFIVIFLTFNGISSILVAITSSISLFCIWWMPPQKMRIIGGFNSFLFIAYQISIKNWAGLLEVAVIMSNFASFVKYKNK